MQHSLGSDCHSIHNFTTPTIFTKFVAKCFEPEFKFTEDGQELIWNKTSEQEA